MEGEIGNGHDAVAERLEICDAHVSIWFAHIELYVPEGPDRFGVWSCRGQLVLESPQAVSASWHRLSLRVLDSNVSVSGVRQPWEVLRERQENVDIAIDWWNGATFSVTGAPSGILHLEPTRRTGQTRDGDST